MPPIDSHALGAVNGFYNDIYGTLGFAQDGTPVSTTRTVPLISKQIQFNITSFDLGTAISSSFNLNGRSVNVSLTPTSSGGYTGTLTMVGTNNNTINLSFAGESILTSELYFNYCTFYPGYTFQVLSDGLAYGDEYAVTAQCELSVTDGYSSFMFEPLTDTASVFLYGNTIYPSISTFVPAGFTNYVSIGEVTLYSVTPTPVSTASFSVGTSRNAITVNRRVTNQLLDDINNNLAPGFTPSPDVANHNQAISSDIDTISSFEDSNFNNLSSSFDRVNIESMDMSELTSGFALVSSVVNAIFTGSGVEYQVFLYGLLAIGVIVVLLSVVGRIGRGVGGG